MTMLARLSHTTPTAPPTPVGPPAAPGGPVGAAPWPPTAPPAGTAPSAPLTGISATLVTDLTEASRLAGRAVEMLATLPPGDTGSEATKDLRIRIFNTNMAVQKRLEKQVDAGNSTTVLSELRRADAHLEDANWQLARKPSPDGRFNGVDIPGAVRDTVEGARIIDELLRAAGGSPSTPSTPPPVQPPTGPLPPVGPPPSEQPPVDEPPIERPPSGPPTAPDAPPATPPGPAPGDDYPGEDEFPTDDRILGDG